MISIPLLRNYAKQRAVANEIAGIQKEINDFESKNKDLSEMLSYLQSNASLEEQARLNLGLKKPGEKVIVINAKDMASSSDATAGPEETSNFIKWWHYFFKH
ncbi:MAG: septum formation initiator family protein [Candidatus Falkowbacteria bacterium]|nr:septum formation initiator family protein [Candidatus Falkowbacteria bacterium]